MIWNREGNNVRGDTRRCRYGCVRHTEIAVIKDHVDVVCDPVSVVHAEAVGIAPYVMKAQQATRAAIPETADESALAAVVTRGSCERSRIERVETRHIGLLATNDFIRSEPSPRGSSCHPEVYVECHVHSLRLLT